MASTDFPSPGEDPASLTNLLIAGVTPTMRRVAAGEALFRRGDDTFGIFYLVAGQVRLIRVTADGTEVPMHTANHGELFAEASLFSSHYHCDAIATMSSKVALYSKKELVQQLQVDGEAMWAFAAEMATRIQQLRAQREILQVRSASERVLQSLRLQCNAARIWAPKGTLKQFAQEIGLTHEALYRALAKLEQDGYLTRDAGTICLNGPPDFAVKAD
jgi:CRP-like cAMP-binding protein